VPFIQRVPLDIIGSYEPYRNLRRRAFMRLANKVAIITGGGSGIGRASSIIFSREGARVVVAQRTAATGEETVERIRAKGGHAIFVPTDITVAADARWLIETTMAKFGKIDILFNNAGMTQSKAPFEDTEESVWEAIYAVNVKGTFLVTKYAVPEMKKLKSGVIINTASMAAVRPRTNSAAYASAKAAVVNLTRALALELAPYNIRVNCVNPVVTETPMTRGMTSDKLPWAALKKQWLQTIPLGHIAAPEDSAYAALYLASDEASMITGTSINVDGGRAI
jgi:3-oxoacyl-[acyl-carrier protein] reductase